MKTITGRIQLFHNLFLACVTGMLFFLIISLFLFVRLKMKAVIGFFTGKQAKREILKLEKSDFGKRGNIKNAASHTEIEEKLPLMESTKKLKGVAVTKFINRKQ